MTEQISLLDIGKAPLNVNKKIRLIELFGGIGTQAMALRNIGADFEHHRLVEWEVSCIKSYKAIHMPNDNTDYSKDLSKTELQERLFRYGISTDGKSSLSQKEIRKKPEKWLRETYNNIKATNNLCSICNIKGPDLEITETDKYCYIVTYSFPCQDLSAAGSQKGMSKGSGTRSGLLWEVERLLNEVEELPQILLMENVPQVISKKNIADFEKWEQFLTSKGYSNYVQLLNAKNYGVAQNRNRCFMVSVLGDYYYEFPKPIPLKKTMKDYLEDEVDEKYYINSEKAQKLIEQLVESGKLEKTQQVSYCLDANYSKGTSVEDFIEKHKRQLVCTDLSVNEPDITEISNCITARQDRGISKQDPVSTGVAVEVKDKETLGGIYLNASPKSEQHDAGLVEVERRVIEVNVIGQMDNKMDNTFESANRVYDTNGIAPTINTCGGGDREPKIIEDFYKNRELRVYDETAPTIRAEREGLKVIEEKIIVASRGRNPDNPSDRKQGIKLEQRLEPNSEGICNTLTSVQKDNLVLEPKVVQAVGDRGNHSYSVKDTAFTIPANPMSDRGQMVLEPKLVGGLGEKDWTGDSKRFSRQFPQGERVYDVKGIACRQTAQGGGTGSYTGLYLVKPNRVSNNVYGETETTEDNKFIRVTDDGFHLARTDKKKSSIQGTHVTFEDGKVHCMGTSHIPKVLEDSVYRIRRLTPKECWRLMGISDKDFHKAEQVNSNTQLYKQAGNAIVVSVLEAIFCLMNIQSCPTWEEYAKERYL